MSPKEKRKTQRKFSGKKTMNALLVTGIALWASFNLYIITPGNLNLGNLNPFSKTAPATYSPRPAASPVLETIHVNTPNIQPAGNEAVNPVVEEKVKPESIEEKKAEENIPATPAPETVVEVTGNYFVVAGVFKIHSNAENLLAKLKSDGYGNAGSIERENKPTMIFVSRHQQREDAVQSLQSLKEKGIDAWVYAGKN